MPNPLNKKRVRLSKRLLRRLQQLEKLIQLRQYHDTGTAIGGFSCCCAVVGNRAKLSTTGSYHFSRIQAILLLQQANHGGRPLHAQVPVVADRTASGESYVVGMSLYHELQIRLILQYGSHFAQYLFCFLVDVIAAALEQQLIRNVDINNALVDFDVDVLIVQVADCSLQIHDERHIHGIFFRHLLLQRLDIRILGAHIVHRLADAFRLLTGNYRHGLQLLDRLVVVLFEKFDLIRHLIRLGSQQGFFPLTGFFLTSQHGLLGGTLVQVALCGFVLALQFLVVGLSRFEFLAAYTGTQRQEGGSSQKEEARFHSQGFGV